jgi:uncharacterized YceG family protein
VSDEYPGGDPFVDPNDPEAVEREERRRERAAKRQQKASKKSQKKAAAPPPPPVPKEPPAKPRTPEQEFWDEPAEPATPPPGQEPSALPKADPEKAERGRRRLFGRRKASGAAAASDAPAAPPTSETPRPGPAAPPTGETPRPGPAAPPTGETPRPQQAAPPTGESPRPAAAPATGEQPTPQSPGPATGEQPVAPAPASPTREEPLPRSAAPATGEQPVPQSSGSQTAESLRPDPGPQTAESPRPDPGQPTGESPLPTPGPPTAESPLPDPGPATAEAPLPDPFPPTTEAPHQPAAEVPRADPGPGTAKSIRPDPNQPTRERRALPPRPLEQTGAGDWEPPPPRDDWFDDPGDEDFHDDGDPDMAGAARHGRRGGEDGGRRGGIFGALLRHPFRILAVIVLIVILIFLNALFQPFHGEGHGRVEVTIPKGSSVGEVGELLEQKGVISDGLIVSGSTLFQARVTIAGKRSSLYAGKFTLAKDMSYGEAIDALSEEPNAAKPNSVTVTIPEGYTRSQASQLVKEDGLRGNYMKATVKSKYLQPAKYGGKGAKNLEGFLFPDTFEMKRHEPVSNLVQLQLEDFKRKIKHVNMKYARSKNLTIFDVLTIASIIEHETGTASQRKEVASVIYNRLREGMTLGSDATVRFATGNFTKPLTQSQLESNSPYNTRVHAGLPPGPISNPGLATINAAAHPAKGDDLFFVTSPNCKTLNFSKTEAEFERDVQKYEASKCTE